MKRLTTDKPMGMYELAHNGCYIDENRKARYRDFETDIDARDLTRKLMVAFGQWKSCEEYGLDADNELIDDDIFDDTMLDYLGNYPSAIAGLIALFYRNLWSMAELRERLKHYEYLEEQGLLLKLPCMVGDTVYRINQYAKEPIISMKVLQVRYMQLHQNLTTLRIDTINDNDMGENCYFQESIGNYLFLTKEEAEAKLQDLQNGVTQSNDGVKELKNELKNELNEMEGES